MIRTSGANASGGRPYRRSGRSQGCAERWSRLCNRSGRVKQTPGAGGETARAANGRRRKPKPPPAFQLCAAMGATPFTLTIRPSGRSIAIDAISAFASPAGHVPSAMQTATLTTGAQQGIDRLASARKIARQAVWTRCSGRYSTRLGKHGHDAKPDSHASRRRPPATQTIARSTRRWTPRRV